MTVLIIFLGWLVINIWATSFVSRRGPGGAMEVLYYALIWLTPFLGAALAILVPSLGTQLKSTDSTDKMFQTVVDKHKSNPTT